MNKKWWKEAVVYQVYIKSFLDTNGDGIGDLRGILNKLDYLKELGVNCLWLNPIFQSPDVDNGYDVSDYYKIQDKYGSMEDFLELLSGAHARGIRLILDMVLNHSSDEHFWFQESRKSKDNPYREFYYWRPAKNGKEPNNWGNYFHEGRGSAWEWDETTQEYYLHNYSKKMPDLNWESQKLREECYKLMNYWLDLGVDGFRMDAINRLKKPAGLPDSHNPPQPPVSIYGYVVDRTVCANCEGIHELLHEMNERVFSRHDALVVGETGNIDSEMAVLYTAEERGEIGELFHFEIAKNVNKVDALEYKAVQKRWYEVIKKNGWITQYLTNHDSARPVSWFGNDKELRYETATMLALLTHTHPGTVYIYQGEEIGMTNVDFPSIDYYNEKYMVGKYWTMVEAGVDPQKALDSLKPLSRDNVRTPMQWDATENAGFSTNTPWMHVNPNYPEINVEAEAGRKKSVLGFYKKLTALRRQEPIMVYGSYRQLYENDPELIAYERELDGKRWLVLANFTENLISAEGRIDSADFENARLLLSNYEELGDFPRTVRPYEARLYELERG